MGGDNMSEWISTKDRLPDKEGCYLIVSGETKEIDIGLWCLERQRFEVVETEWFGYEITGVTHWMPLPEPPKESDNS